MNDVYLEPILELLKIDLGIRQTATDVYLETLVTSVYEELTKHYGLPLDESISSDLMLISDYSAWRYRSRGQDDSEMPKNIQQRITDRKIMERARNGEGTEQINSDIR